MWEKSLSILRHGFYKDKRMKLYEPFSIVFLHKSFGCSLRVIPLAKNSNGIPDSFEIIMEGIMKGVIHFSGDKWISYDIEDQSFVELIGKCIYEIYQKSDELSEISESNSFSLN